MNVTEAFERLNIVFCTPPPTPRHIADWKEKARTYREAVATLKEEMREQRDRAAQMEKDLRQELAALRRKVCLAVLKSRGFEDCI